MRAAVFPLLETGRITPVIDSTFALEAAADAHRRRGGGHFGKVVLTV